MMSRGVAEAPGTLLGAVMMLSGRLLHYPPNLRSMPVTRP